VLAYRGDFELFEGQRMLRVIQVADKVEHLKISTKKTHLDV
jgi:hypothetical protein